MRGSRDQVTTNNNQQSLASVPPPQRSRLLLGTRPARRTPYDSKTDRPMVQLGLRAALWGALAVGCVGGGLAIIRPGDDDRPPAEDRAAEDWIVPGPVSAVAVDTVMRWMTAGVDEREALADLFVEAPDPEAIAAGADDAGGGLRIPTARAVAGSLLQDGYWSVTVALDVVRPAAEQPVGEAQPEGADGSLATWFVEIGVVADDNGGYKALATPAVVPAPKAGDPQWHVAGDSAPPEADDPLTQTVQKFLAAVLTGTGDPAPYLAPGAEATAADPAPFSGIEIVEISTKPLDDDRTWVLVKVRATTADHITLPLSYDLTVVQRVDRYEVEALSGVPTFIE